MKFRIRVEDADGQESAVTLNAEDRESALAEAKRRGLRPLSIQPVPANEREAEEEDDDDNELATTGCRGSVTGSSVVWTPAPYSRKPCCG